MPTEQAPRDARWALASGHVRAGDLAVCQRLLSRGSRSFSVAGLLLPPTFRRDAAVIYGYCRLADDAVDDSDSPAQGLARLHERLDAIYGSAPLTHPVDRAFRAVAARVGIPRDGPAALLEGFAWDLEGRRYEDLSGVVAYSVRVASTVGLMMTLAMGVRDTDTLARACELGIAMQLTNIARDVGEDARNGRVYLPLSWLADGDVDAEVFVARPTASAGIRNAVRHLLNEAGRLYVRAEGGIVGLPRRARPAIWAARLIYAEIGAVIAARDHDSVSTRAVVPDSRKAALMARALWASRAAGEVDTRAALPEARALVDACTTWTRGSTGGLHP